MRLALVTLVAFGCSPSDAVEVAPPAPVPPVVVELDPPFVPEPELEPEPEPVVEAELDPADVRALVRAALERRGREDDFDCLASIFEAEASWKPDAIGDVGIGGSYGLPQRHAPAHGKPELPWPIDDQVEWALAYADERYGGVCEAWEAWSSRATVRNGRLWGGWW